MTGNHLSNNSDNISQSQTKQNKLPSRDVRCSEPCPRYLAFRPIPSWEILFHWRVNGARRDVPLHARTSEFPDKRMLRILVGNFGACDRVVIKIKSITVSEDRRRILIRVIWDAFRAFNDQKANRPIVYSPRGALMKLNVYNMRCKFIVSFTYYFYTLTNKQVN